MASGLLSRNGLCGCRRRISPTVAAVILLVVLGSAAGAANESQAVTSALNSDLFQASSRMSGCVPNPSQYYPQAISNLKCEDIVVDLPFELKFKGKQIGIGDKTGVSTGMRMHMPSTSNVQTYKKNLVVVQPGSKSLRLQGLIGSWEKKDNRLRNALGVGLPVPNNALKMEVKVKMPKTADSGREKFCLWVAVSDKEFVWLCCQRKSGGYRLYMFSEFDDAKVVRKFRDGVKLEADRQIVLRLDIVPADSQVRGSYQVTGKGRNSVADINVAPLTLNVDQAGTDPLVGSRTMGGFVGIRRAGQPPPKFFVKAFTVEVLLTPIDTGTGEQSVDFSTWRVPDIMEPTSMVWAGDRLWVASVQGSVYSIQFNGGRTVATKIKKYNPIGPRMLTGICKDPNYAANKCLWLSHSSPSQNEGAANSGKVTKVCGSNLSSVKDVIKGLPRAKANHATNNCWFQDRKLYLAVGGNTASGSPNLQPIAFGTRPEQYLAAAILRFNVKKVGFKGNCRPTQNPNKMDATGIAQKSKPDCDAEIYATGMRNCFSCTFHSNGELYCPCNAIGGRGSVPKLKSGYKEGDSCDGIVKGAAMDALDPGIRHDMLFKVTKGKYYGHPNPARKECVMDGGNPTGKKDFPAPVMPVTDGQTYGYHVKDVYSVGTKAHSNYEKPIASFGRNRSPNGIIEYKSNKMCGNLKKQLLTSWFSVETQIRRIQLDSDGKVKNDGTLRRSDLATGGITLNKPLGLIEDDKGNIFTAEFAGNSIAIFNPRPASCSRRTAAATAPLLLEGAASASNGSQLYAFGGRREEQATGEAHTYDAASDTWESLPDLPEPLADAGAVVEVDGTVLIVGGEKEDGSVSVRVWSFDPKTREYSVHSDLPEPRTGAVVEIQDGMPVVVGGVAHDGMAPVADMLRFVARSSWEALPEMSEPRAYAAGAVGADGKLLVCGGRMLRAGVHTLTQSCERFNGAQWQTFAPMSEARSHHAFFAHGRQFVVKGGYVEDGSISDSIEMHDPEENKWTHVGNMRTGRSSAIHGELGGEMYTFAGRTEVDLTRFGDAVHIN